MMNQVTLKQAIKHGVIQLTNSESAKLDSELLLSWAIHQSREYLYSHPEYVLNTSEFSDYNSLLDKRVHGFPIAYLTGTKEFWSRTFNVNRHTLVPRPETECLVETVLNVTRAERADRILDLGTGSGAIAVVLAMERPSSRITATDICPYALSMASENARAHDAGNIKFIQSDWFDELTHHQFDVIASNPPYVESNSTEFTYGDIRHEPRLALDGGNRGMDAFIRIIPQSVRHLNPGGTLILEHGYLKGEEVRNIMAEHGFKEVQSFTDYVGNERVSIGKVAG
ncbi:MAG: peptide chain release factor N(5)-glutamine methyltransferase [Gammaproteobacteria bacterium]|nr:peptide chain release factor N(5)-glutamine methyltransferase [Gammaproteobacteria bacterium]